MIVCQDPATVDAARRQHPDRPVLDVASGWVYLPGGAAARMSPWRCARALEQSGVELFEPKAEPKPAPEPAPVLDEEPIP